MPIRDLQTRLTEVGRIRLGERTSSGRPSRLDTFRFTSQAQYLIEEVAALYGGRMVEWAGSPRGKQWEVVTTATLIPVFVPPQTVDPWYESWAKAVCTRRCDGVRDVIHDKPCDCKPEKRACKPTTRVNLMLADVPGLGVWRLETHGIYAAGEMVQLSQLISGIEIPLPGRLLLDHRESKQFDREEGKVVTKDFNVPVILIDAVTSRHVQIGSDAVSQVLKTGAAQAAAAIASAEAPALEAAPAPARQPEQRQAPARQPQAAPPPPAAQPNIPAGLAAIAKAETRDELAAIRKRIDQYGDPAELLQAFDARVAELTQRATESADRKRAEAAKAAREAREARLDAEEQAEQERRLEQQEREAADREEEPPYIDGEAEETEPPTREGEGQPEPPAEVDDPAERKAAMMHLLGVAGSRKMKTADIDARLQEHYGVDRQSATAGQLRGLAVILG